MSASMHDGLGEPRGPLRVLLGRGIANHAGLVDLVRSSDLGREVRVGVQHTSAPDGRSTPDVFVREPPTRGAEGHVDASLAACDAWGASAFWPGRDLACFARRTGEFASRSVALLLAASAPVIELLDDKAAFAKAATAAGVRSPVSIPFDTRHGFEQAYGSLIASGERVCFKPVRGIFGLGFRVVRTDIDLFDELLQPPSHRIDLDDALRRFSMRETFPAFVAMPWLEGPEWSVDCFRSRDGKCFVAIPRRKIDSATQVLDDAPELVSACRILAERFDLVGIFNCQFRSHRGTPHVLEINPRPAGGIGLSRYSGISLAECALRDTLGLPVLQAVPRFGTLMRSVAQWEQRGESATAEREDLMAHLPAQDLVRDLPAGRVEVMRTGGDDSLASLLDVGVRRNAGRPYLLVSRVLGKHIGVTPSRMVQTHDRLATGIPVDLTGPVIFVGMAETATGLGWGVFEAWRKSSGRSDALYLHTTRYPVPGHRALPFEEHHSHGPAQVLCPPMDRVTVALWGNARSLVVVDDEVTTGATVAALARAVTADGVPIGRQVIVSLVTSADAVAPHGPLSTWHSSQLVSVRVRYSGDPGAPIAAAPQGLTTLAPRVGSTRWGRTGAEMAPSLPMSIVALAMEHTRGASCVYVIGAGEAMHPAFVLGRALELYGRTVLVQSSSRSPVAVYGAIKASLPVDDGLGSGVPFFVHNPPPPGSKVIALHERGAAASARALVTTYGAIPIEVWDA